MSFAGLGGGEVKLLVWLEFKLELNFEPIIEFRANKFGLVESLGWRPKKRTGRKMRPVHVNGKLG